VWLVVVLFVLGEVPLVIAYHRAPTAWQSTIVFAASVLGGAFALFSYLKNIEEQRRQASDRLVQRWNEPSLAPLKEPLREILEGRLQTATLQRGPGVTLTADVLKSRSAVVNILNFYEEIAILVHTKGADEERLRRFFGAVVVDGYAKLESWIQHERQLDNRQQYYRDLEQLAARWRTKE